jgi:hypothetical protein
MTIQELRADLPKTKDMRVLKQWILKGSTATERLQRLAIVGRKTNPNLIFIDEATTH